MIPKIAIIDTKVNTEHYLLKNKNINNRDILKNKGIIHSYRHGTAVCAEIIKECPSADIDVYPIFDENFEAAVSDIITVMEHINNFENYNVINMSLGFEEPCYSEKLELLLNEIINNGSIIIAAFDNMGAMSYPAAYKNVISVDMADEKINRGDYIYIENGCVNILFGKYQKRIAWDKPSMTLAYGTSFLAAQLSGFVCKDIADKSNKNPDYIMSMIKDNAVKHRYFKKSDAHNNTTLDIEKAIVFPVNKEILTLLKLSNHLDFKIVGVFDFKFSKHINSEIQDYDQIHQYIVKSISSINWDSFDTIIIGHVDKYWEIGLGEKIADFIKKCVETNKQIYFYDKFIENKMELSKKSIFTPNIEKAFLPHAQMGKMWSVSVPVIGVVGTSSHQGKFSSQVRIISCLKNKGYKTGFIATEPSGYLFNADFTFPYGYNSTVNLQYEDYPIAVNKMLHLTGQKDIDLIITGTQSGLIPRNTSNMNQLTSIQLSILFGLNIDAVVLCISIGDDLDHIKRSISVLESYLDIVILGVLVSPVLVQISESGLVEYNNIGNSDEYKAFVIKLNLEIGHNVFEMNRPGINGLCESMINSLEE